jgi:hypothetical protein
MVLRKHTSCLAPVQCYSEEMTSGCEMPPHVSIKLAVAIVSGVKLIKPLVSIHCIIVINLHINPISISSKVSFSLWYSTGAHGKCERVPL